MEKLSESLKGVRFVQLLFVDITGRMKSTTISHDHFISVLEHGIGFDGSSVEGFARVCESDMVLKPDMSTLSLLPESNHTTATVFCDAYLPDGRPFEGDPRFILKRVLSEAEKMGYSFQVGPELEFFLFSRENGVSLPHDAGSYFDFAPVDLGSEIRKDVMVALESMGIVTEMGHHECAPGQHEIDLKYGDALKLADSVMTLKYLVKLTAGNKGLFGSFMPKPLLGKAGSGMHIHQSLWDGKGNLFFDEGNDYSFSKAALHFLGGQLNHAAALTCVLAPTVNSYKRLVSGYEAPVHVCWGRKNRSALIRVPYIQKSSHARLEFRAADPSCNPYLGFASLLACGLEGIKRKVQPPLPVEEDVYAFNDAKLSEFYISQLPANLYDATCALEKDFVLQSALGSFTHNTFIKAKRMEWDAYKIQITDWERETYFPIL